MPANRRQVSIVKTACAAALALCPLVAAAVECSATSTWRVPLLELYTSEGCDSCPPAERWINGLPGRGLPAERIVALAFHVDYWNHLGWVDPYARPEFSARQRAAAQRKTARFVYTPQLLLNGQEYRRGTLRDDLAARVATINQEAPPATIRLTLGYDAASALTATGEVTVEPAARRPGTAGYLVLYESRLVTRVLAGENRGRQLEHDFVVRELAGPYSLDTRDKARYGHDFRLDRAWKNDQLHVASFVQHEGSGEILQALTLARCLPR